MSAERLWSLRKALPAHFSDHSRLEGIAQGCGTWFDLDINLLRALPTQDYLFGWENRKTICNAVLRLPQECPMLNEYLALRRRSDTYRAPPWYPWKPRGWPSQRPPPPVM